MNPTHRIALVCAALLALAGPAKASCQGDSCLTLDDYIPKNMSDAWNACQQHAKRDSDGSFMIPFVFPGDWKFCAKIDAALDRLVLAYRAAIVAAAKAADEKIRRKTESYANSLPDAP